MALRTVSRIGCLILMGMLMTHATGCSEQSRSGFVREIWVLGGDNNFRVNSPDAKDGPFKERWEARKDGVLVIEVDQDLADVASAELYLELWGGHPGVANKRFTLNGQSEYQLPEVSAAANNCTYSYPSVELKLDELRQGANAFAFTCDRGDTFWGHFLIRTACLRLHLKSDSGTLKDEQLAGEFVEVRVSADPTKTERRLLDIDASERLKHRIARVEYWGRYEGYDENGDGNTYDWHGYTKDGEPVGNIGVIAGRSFTAVSWSLAMVPRVVPVEARARVHVKGSAADLVYETEAAPVAPADATFPVKLVPAAGLPRPFWSRAGQPKQCAILLDVEPQEIEQAELHVAVWDGGAGDAEHPVTLNGEPLSVAGSGHHDVLYRVLPIDPSLLRKGENTFKVLSDTDHHGIEVLLPGPALVVRLRSDADAQTGTGAAEGDGQ